MKDNYLSQITNELTRAVGQCIFRFNNVFCCYINDSLKNVYILQYI